MELAAASPVSSFSNPLLLIRSKIADSFESSVSASCRGVLSGVSSSLYGLRFPHPLRLSASWFESKTTRSRSSSLDDRVPDSEEKCACCSRIRNATKTSAGFMVPMGLLPSEGRLFKTARRETDFDVSTASKLQSGHLYSSC